MRMRDGAYITDGTKAVPLSALRPEAWTPADDDEISGAHSLSTRRAKTRVPVLFRAIDIRAKAVAGMPFRLDRAGQDITDDDETQPLIKQLRSLLYLTEASLCCYNAAYWELGTNQFGFNLTPFWLATPTITPDIDWAEGLRGFWRTGRQGGYLKPKQVCYFWGSSTDIEIGPDPMMAPVAVTLGAAGLLHYLDRFATGFFQRGGTKITLLSIDGNPPPKEIEKLDAWWKRMVYGVKSAFGSVVVRAGIKPQVIGSNVNETSAPQLTKLAREDVAIGMGVPLSLLFSNALAGGTVDAERLNFYDFTVVPECEQIIDGPINEMYLDRLGLKLIFTPEKLEVYQRSELSKAQALGQLVGQPLMTVDEGRERLELPPMADVAPPTATEQTPTTPPTPPDDAHPADPAAEPPVATDEASSVLLPGTFDALRAAEMGQWERKALKRLKRGGQAACDFQSDWIDPHDAALITHGLQHADSPAAVKAAFKVAAPGSDLTDDEQMLYDRLQSVFSTMAKQTAQTIEGGGTPDPSALSAAIRASLLTVLTEVVSEHMGQLSDEFGISFDDPSAGIDIAGAYVTKYSQQMDTTSRTALEKAITTYRATPGMGRNDLLTMLRPVFGDRRAELIAISSLTEASNQATKRYQAMLKGNGITMERVWRTANDERVCFICTPLNGKPESEWADRFPDGGPAHFRCRCSTTLRMPKK